MVDFRSAQQQVSRLKISGFETTGEFWRDAHILATDLDRFAYVIKTFTVPLRESVEKVIIPSIRTNYDVEGRPRKWQALSEATLNRRQFLNQPILQQTGDMKRVTTSVGVWVIGVVKAEMIGVNRRNKYAKFHQAGTRQMPQRVIAIIQEQDQREIELIFMRWVVMQSILVGRYKAFGGEV